MTNTLTKEQARIRHTIRKLLDRRAAGASICPSEAARVLYMPDDWRARMPAIREVAAAMVSTGELEVTQGGKIVDPQKVCGPIRLLSARSNPH